MIVLRMVTLQVDIQQKQREIELHQNDLQSLYAELGRSVSLVEQITQIGYAHAAYESYSKELEKYEKAQKEYDQLSGFIQQIEDRSRQIKQIEADIRLLEKPKQQAFSQLGAIAYEAYGSETLAVHIKEVCAPYFEEHQQKINAIELQSSKPLGKLYAQVLRYRKDLARKQLLPLLIQAGSALMRIGCENDFPLEEKPHLREQLTFLKEREAELRQELELHKSAMAKLRTQEMQSPKARLEQCNANLKLVSKAYDKASSVYGLALYETLPEDVNAALIGYKALALMDQITLHRKRVKVLESQIQTLQNQIKAQELEAQIELEQQKIDHLTVQIDSYNRQIAQVSASIDIKRKQIVQLLSEKEEHIDG